MSYDRIVSYGNQCDKLAHSKIMVLVICYFAYSLNNNGPVVTYERAHREETNSTVHTEAEIIPTEIFRE